MLAGQPDAGVISIVIGRILKNTDLSPSEIPIHKDPTFVYIECGPSRVPDFSELRGDRPVSEEMPILCCARSLRNYTFLSPGISGGRRMDEHLIAAVNIWVPRHLTYAYP